MGSEVEWGRVVRQSGWPFHPTEAPESAPGPPVTPQQPAADQGDDRHQQHGEAQDRHRADSSWVATPERDDRHGQADVRRPGTTRPAPRRESGPGDAQHRGTLPLNAAPAPPPAGAPPSQQQRPGCASQHAAVTSASPADQGRQAAGQLAPQRRPGHHDLGRPRHPNTAKVAAPASACECRAACRPRKPGASEVNRPNSANSPRPPHARRRTPGGASGGHRHALRPVAGPGRRCAHGLGHERQPEPARPASAPRRRGTAPPAVAAYWASSPAISGPSPSPPRLAAVAVSPRGAGRAGRGRSVQSLR